MFPTSAVLSDMPNLTSASKLPSSSPVFQRTRSLFESRATSGGSDSQPTVASAPKASAALPAKADIGFSTASQNDVEALLAHIQSMQAFLHAMDSKMVASDAGMSGRLAEH